MGYTPCKSVNYNEQDIDLKESWNFEISRTELNDDELNFEKIMFNQKFRTLMNKMEMLIELVINAINKYSKFHMIIGNMKNAYFYGRKKYREEKIL